MNLLVGFGLGGPALARRRSRSRARLGEPAFGATGLLRDLELRLGLSPVDDSPSTRIPRWVARIKSLRAERAFYKRSFEIDEVGTAAALLDWRDALVEAGWDGGPILGGGERLETLAALEDHERAGMPLGRADRLVRVERALATAGARSRIYESLTFVEDIASWPRRWRSIFAHLEGQGTALSRLELELPGAPPASDLGLLQARLRGEKRAGEVRGDGSMLLVRGDTPTDLAELTAALLADGRASGAVEVVVRCRDAESLEAALSRYGLPPQGCSSESVWRPAMQVLPLAIELAFEPRDPYRLLELLTLPVGPFRGVLGARLARAVARQPGTGGKEWTLQKAEGARRLHEQYARLERERGAADDAAERAAAALVEARLSAVTEWLETKGVGPRGATPAELLAVAERVREWLKGRLRGGDVEIYGAAYAQIASFVDALAHDTREALSLEDARQLVDKFARAEQAHDLWDERAGRVAHVDHPSALLAPCDRLVLWSFVSGVERRPARLPWNEEERVALEATGISFVDPTALLRAEAEAWRRAVLAARERVVFVAPRTIAGTATAPHPLWDEVCARLALDDRGVARLTREARRVLDEAGAGLVAVATCPPLPLPEPRGVWSVAVEAAEPARDGTTSVTALEKIATCPLAWVLEHRAALRPGAASTVATGALLNGALSHRLVEELHAEAAFDLSEDAFLARTRALFEALLVTEGATLLLPGASIERLQLTRQVIQGMRELYRYLARLGLRIAGVEEVITTGSAVGPLHGRLDLRLVDHEGRAAVLDLKWGASTYRARLAEGRAVQLAAYSRAVAASGGVPPPAAYFALSSGEALSTDPRMAPGRVIDGPSLEQTWSRAETTARAVIERLEHGEVLVSGTRRSLPLLDALGIDEARRDGHLETTPGIGCAYCDYGPICGRKWEVFA